MTTFRIFLPVGVTAEQMERLASAIAAAHSGQCHIERVADHYGVETPKAREDRRTLSAREVARFAPPTPWPTHWASVQPVSRCDHSSR